MEHVIEDRQHDGGHSDRVREAASDSSCRLAPGSARRTYCRHAPSGSWNRTDLHYSAWRGSYLNARRLVRRACGLCRREAGAGWFISRESAQCFRHRRIVTKGYRQGGCRRCIAIGTGPGYQLALTRWPPYRAGRGGGFEVFGVLLQTIVNSTITSFRMFAFAHRMK